MSWSATTGLVGAGGADAAAAFPVRRGTALCRPQYRLSERRRGCTPPRNPSVILAPRPGLEPGTYGLTDLVKAPEPLIVHRKTHKGRKHNTAGFVDRLVRLHTIEAAEVGPCRMRRLGSTCVSASKSSPTCCAVPDQRPCGRSAAVPVSGWPHPELTVSATLRSSSRQRTSRARWPVSRYC
jgi:hypothetical protein